MKNLLFTTIICLALISQTQAQRVAIGAGSPTPHPSSVLDLQATDKGFLIPRIANPSSISSPATGLMVYNTTTNKFNYYNGTAWVEIGTGSGNGTVTSVDFAGGTTGLTTSGGPVTTSGTITLAGTLALINGGTGATTAAAARTNLGLGIAAVLNTGTTSGTVATGDHTHTFASLTSTPTTLAGYGITNALPISGGTLTGILVGQGSTGLINAVGQGTPSFEVYANATNVANNAAYMTFHRPGLYAVRFGLDNDNVMKVGGWSANPNSYRVMLGDGYINESTLRIANILDVRNSTANTGWVGLTPGNTAQTGYISWHRTTGARQAYMGWDNTNLTLVLEGGSNYSISGGTVTIGNLAGTGNRPVYANASGTLNTAPAAGSNYVPACPSGWTTIDRTYSRTCVRLHDMGGNNSWNTAHDDAYNQYGAKLATFQQMKNFCYAGNALIGARAWLADIVQDDGHTSTDGSTSCANFDRVGGRTANDCRYYYVAIEYTK